MSELSEVFKKAALTFTHASDFIVSLYEGGYMVAEDISDKLAEERKLYQAPVTDRFEIEGEIGGAVAFFGKLLPALLMAQIALPEDCLLEICEIAARQANVPFAADLSDRFTAQKALQFFQEKLGVSFPVLWAAWEKIREIH